MPTEPPSSEEITNALPLPLLRSQIVPPAPNRRRSSIDFIYDFAGSSWIAYGASSLLVISHFPSPLSEPQTLVGPSFRQVIDPAVPPPCSAGDVAAVSWCPALPSDGEIAAAVGDCVFLFNPDSGTVSGSFCWRQTAGLMQSFTVEAIEWTGSGDGLITAGMGVALWKRKNKSWEIAWKFNAEFPQGLVSATWYAEGLVATAANFSVHCIDIDAKNCSLPREDCACVSVYHSDEGCSRSVVQLCHPQPVTWIQWRPFNFTPSSTYILHPWRDLLLTCCEDGTVRLWGEIDNSRGKKISKNTHEHKSAERAFHVVAVIEINLCMRGMLGTDIFMEWAIDIGSLMSKIGPNSYYLSNNSSENDQIGKCEWLISIGPMHTLSFWAIHCLDDTNPLRFPRVTLWKKQNLMDFSSYNLCNHDSTNVKDQPILIKAIALRDRAFGPPVECSLLQLLPTNSVCWSQLYTPTQIGGADRSLMQLNKEKSLSCFAGGVLNEDGHTGSILKLAIHPFCEIEIAASLDSNGSILFWSLPMISDCTLGMQMLSHSVWKLLGKISSRDLSSDIKYSNLSWAPSVLDENLFLLLGHADGIDCFLITFPGVGKNISCDRILTVPFADHSHGEGPPDQLCITPLISSCGQSFFSNSFLMFATWTKKTHASSWKIILHSREPSRGSCGCRSDEGIIAISGKDTPIAGRVLYATINIGSSLFPDQQSLDHVISVSATSPDLSMLSLQQRVTPTNALSNEYHIATGCSDGTLKLWKMSYAESSNSEPEVLPWELVGMFTAHECPISAIALSSNSGKIATVSMNDRNSTTSLHIWEPICLIDGGSFLLEDAIILNGPVISVNWLSIGNGRLLLAVCLPNESRIYAEKRCDLFLAKSRKSREMNIWCCIALSRTFPVSHNFSWGPKVTPVVVHHNYFSVLSQWLFISESGSVQEGSGRSTNRSGTDEKMPFPIFAESGMISTIRSSETFGNQGNGLDMSMLFSKICQAQCDFNSDTGIRTHNLLDVADRLCETLAVYHPLALLQHLYSGNRKRAYIVLKHLVEAINQAETSSTSLESKFGKACYYVPEIDLSMYWEEIVYTELHSKGLQWGSNIDSGTADFHVKKHAFQFADGILNSGVPEKPSSVTSTKSEMEAFIDTLERFPEINALKNIDRAQLFATIDLLGELNESSCSSAYDSLDKPGRRFWVAVRFQCLYSLRKFQSSVAEEVVVNSRLLAWAFQSDCQENLLSSLLSDCPSWVEMRNLGVGFWFTNVSQLRTRMEKLARSQYLERKDPKDCALLYLALNRLQVLAGLFKVSRNEKDKLLVGFLSRNFQEEKNKAAAVKNAYVLMGRHQLELAIAFFLLGGDPSSAVTVCAKNLGDEQLALVICRLIEGHGGQLEHQLISNTLLHKAIDKEDYWLASMFEWALGNYPSSISKLLDSNLDSSIHNSAVSNLSAFSDPDIAQYCATLATKNNIKNSLGDFRAMVLSKLANLMSVKAFNRCGLPLEALESFSSSLGIEYNVRGSWFDIENHMMFRRVLKPFSSSACNWLLAGIADNLELNIKLSMAMQYLSTFIKDHPSWPLDDLEFSQKSIFHKDDEDEDKKKLYDCMHKVNSAISTFERKHLVKSVDLANMVLVFVTNRGLFFHGYRLLQGICPQRPDTTQDSNERFMLGSALLRVLLKASQEIMCYFSQYAVRCNLTDSILKLFYGSSSTFGIESPVQFHYREFCLRSIIFSVKAIRSLTKLCDYHEGHNLRVVSVLELFEYYVHFASSWFSRNTKGLTLMIKAIQNEPANMQDSFEAIAGELMQVLRQYSECMVHDVSGDGTAVILDANVVQGLIKQSETLMLSIPDEEMWQLIGACLWMHLSGFANYHLSKFIPKERIEDGSAIVDRKIEFFILVTKLFVTSMAYISSSLTRQLASYLRTKVCKGLPLTFFLCLDESTRHQSRSFPSFSSQTIGPLELTDKKERVSLLQNLWEICVNPDEICENFVNERIVCFPSINRKFSSSWSDLQKDGLPEDVNTVLPNVKALQNIGTSTTAFGGESMHHNRSMTDDIETRRSSSPHRDISFRNPMEVLKRSGELLEATCFNSIDEQQGAVASNRKGLLFFHWKTEQQFKEKADYLWSESDWPHDGWAGCESTPVPTYVSQGIGPGSKRGSHIGLGGATGLGSLARPGRELTGGGAFGIPGYAGIGASGFGWGEQEDFDDFADPPATVTNISSRSLSQHPSLPLFLAGSSNTHIYLWEFGKDRATATYGILPLANVPPPYALASVSALQFDHCGHRFASAALDGTVCTWQLEVGGRSNVYPTESSFCFTNHASDVAYVTASGSILAAAGYSVNGVNVVVWDTLAPQTTSQASLVCHEGGARSLSVFDNDVGSGSISPLIVTGGKSGDVGLHDFRFIATGKTKRKNSSQQDFKSAGVHDNGMLWYIPKAHLGSITKVATIPNTSLFLTGSKDGDVKLWDAKRSQLVFHWRRMHDRHTFLQANSRSIGGVVRAAVTDIQVFSHGFLTCGGDGCVKLVQLK